MKRAPTTGWRIALVQMPIIMGNKRANVAVMLEMIAEAARKKCEIVVLPECCLAGWLSVDASACAESVPGPLTRRLSRLARQHRIAIVVGMEEKGPDGTIFNAAVLIDETGAIRLHHRKINELEIARTIYSPGSSLEVTTYRSRTVALSICADSWRPEVTDALYLLGARVIISPSAWAVEPGGEATNRDWIIDTYRQRVRARELFIIAPNAVGRLTDGPWKGRVLQGNSLVINPAGELLVCGPTGEPALLCFELPSPGAGRAN